MKIIQLLRKIPLFKGLSLSNLIKISKITKLKHFSKNDIIFAENSFGRSLYIIMKGEVKIYAEHKGKRKIFAYISSGEFFGELALIDDPVRTASAVALADSDVVVINRDEFHKILKSYPDIALNLLKILSRRLRSADKEIESLSFCNVFTRVVKVLLDLNRKYGKTVQGGRIIDFRLDNEEIAQLTGTVREVVVRILKQIIKLGCVKHVAGRRILITNEEKLKVLIN
jgi:CRP-like cAMP-binding protein